jgi:DNA-binding transcriptional LysR family regulator
MMDWDDVRYFLAVARGGSVRAAAEGLGVNHSTVLRRIAQLEERQRLEASLRAVRSYASREAGLVGWAEPQMCRWIPM